MKNKEIRYIKVKDGVISIHSTSDFMKMMKEEYGGMSYDTTDYIFDENLDIRVFVKDLNLDSEEVCINYYYNGDLWSTFNGTVFFSKLGTTKVRSLSKKDIDIIMRNLIPTRDNEFSIYSSSYERYLPINNEH